MSSGIAALAFSASTKAWMTKKSMPPWPDPAAVLAWVFHSGWSYCSNQASCVSHWCSGLRPSMWTDLFKSIQSPFTPCTRKPSE